MRRFRKTRKTRGGVRFSKVFDCPLLKSGKKSAQSTCITEFNKSNNFTLVKTKDDGNCFYDTLSKYGERTGFPTLNKSHLDLRRVLVLKLLENVEEVAPFFLVFNNNSNNNTNNNNNNNVNNDLTNVEREIVKLAKPNVWKSNNADIVIEYAAKAFGIKIIIYDVKEGISTDVINQYVFEPLEPINDLKVVNMLRVNDNHYMLLWPTEGPGAAVLPKGKKSATSARKGTKKANKNINKNNNLNNLNNAMLKIALMESQK